MTEYSTDNKTGLKIKRKRDGVVVKTKLDSNKIDFFQISNNKFLHYGIWLYSLVGNSYRYI